MLIHVWSVENDLIVGEASMMTPWPPIHFVRDSSEYHTKVDTRNDEGSELTRDTDRMAIVSVEEAGAPPPRRDVFVVIGHYLGILK